MGKTLALDLGTNSFGVFVRNTDLGNEITKQAEYFSVDIFNSGVGSSEGKEYSYAAERSSKGRAMQLLEVRRRRKLATIEALIKHKLCPLSQERLNSWKTYDKLNGKKREYPIDDIAFQKWIALDFDADGIADYTSPYQLRKELVNRQFDFTQEIERFKLGRALYHIAQRRGFKSSKGETIKEQENENFNEENYTLKDSEQKKSSVLQEYMSANNLKTVGEAFAHIEKSGIRVRGSIYQAVRSQYKDEIEYIFKYQNGLDTSSELYQRLTSEKKGVGTIFYKNPLKSQKKNIGKCTLETKKTRCPFSHPDYEEFRAWCFINNIKFRLNANDEWMELPLYLKSKIYNEIFCHTVERHFEFRKIKALLEKHYNCTFIYKESNGTINYKDNQSVLGCPVTVRLKKLLGEGWNTLEIHGNKRRQNKSNTEYLATYSAYDLWNICRSADDPEAVTLFAERTLGWDENRSKLLLRLWETIGEGYANLSLKAIRNINYFLRKGLIYSDAVLLAKVPEIIGTTDWDKQERNIIENLVKIKEEHQYEQLVKSITNNLISAHKSLPIEVTFAFKDYKYTLDASDFKDIDKATIETIGKNKWETYTNEKKVGIRLSVAELYQGYFADRNRNYCRIEKITEKIKIFLMKNYSGGNIEFQNRLEALYHHSNFSEYSQFKHADKLASPNIGAIKNPVVMRTLNIMRNKLNQMFENGIVDSSTRVVIETTRDFNDANKRAAIKKYAEIKETEHTEIEKLIRTTLQYTSDTPINKEYIEKGKILLEQNEKENSIEKIYKDKYFEKNVIKYSLWKEQSGVCMYTGEIINFSDLFDDNIVDVEHTIPRSKSFDDSLSNLTICKSHYNRLIKKNRIPTELENYEVDCKIDNKEYTVIKPRLENWKKRIEKLTENVNYWKLQSKLSQTTERKNQCIRQKYLWQMELEYWQNKVNRFLQKDITIGFKNRQLVDTGMITKYAIIYLKSVFEHVTAEKGSVTAAFRKILNIQPANEEKDRTNHTHHAIDAAVLSIIPTAAKRQKILELYYLSLETVGEEKEFYKNELNKMLRSIDIFNKSNKIVDFINKNTLVTHIKKDRALQKTRKKLRHNGKIVYKKNENGELTPLYSQGDCIRGEINLASLFGKIKTNNGEERFVIRKALRYKSNKREEGFTSWKDLEAKIVDKGLFKRLKSQFPEDISFKDACQQGIYMTNNNNEKIHRIRHIRCFAPTNAGPVPLKRHTYQSNKEYKQYIYASTGDLYTIARYFNNGKYIYKPFNLYTISKDKLNNGIANTIEEKGKTYHLDYLFKKNDMLLLIKDNPEEIKKLNTEEIGKRLFYVKAYESDLRITLVKHDIVDYNLGAGQKIESYDELPIKIRCSINTIKYLILGRDFEITKGKIVLKS